MTNQRKKLDVEEIIHKALLAYRIASENDTTEVFKATEKKLYAYPIIKLKIQDDRATLDYLQSGGYLDTNNKSVIQFQKAGVRLSHEDIKEALIQNLKAEIAANEIEIEKIDKALDIFSKDPYIKIIKMKYFEGKKDDEIAENIPCHPSTVRLNKNRIIGNLAVFFYGVKAL